MTNTHVRVSRAAAIAATLTILATTACNKNDTASAATTKTAPDVMSVGPENIAVVKAEEIRSGPALSGSLSAETQATVRAEVSGAILQTFADVGSTVQAGTELVKLDDSGIRDLYLSAKSGVTTAENSMQMAEREARRAESLSKAGAIADRQLEQAKNQLSGTQAQLADARARLANAQKQLEKTTVKAPFTGVVSAKMANAGDFVSPGTATYTIINPSTMRLEASIPAEALSSVRVGVPVQFAVNGYGTRHFTGRISSINPVADPATGQVRVIVTIPNSGGTLVSGLFADGRVAAESRTSAVVPAGAVDERGVRPFVMRLKNGKIEKVEVTIGIRDASTEMVEVRSGLTPGDTVLIGAARGITAGTLVKVSTPTDAKK